MITVVLFCLFLFAFWMENVMDFKLTPVLGLSLQNLCLYFLLMNWALSVFQKKVLFRPCRVNKYIFLLFFIIVGSIPLKFMLGEVSDLSIINEIISLKGWLNPILLFFILYNTLDSPKSLKFALYGLIAFLLVTVAGSIGLASGIYEFGNLQLIKSRTAGFAEPNQYAAFLVLFIPRFYFLLINVKKKNRMFVIFFTVSVFISFVSTGSRGGLISLVFATLVFLFLFYRLKIIHPIVAIVILFVGLPAIGGISLLLSPKSVQNVVLTRMNIVEMDRVEMTSGRTLLWREGFKLFIKSPIVGHGQNTFIPLMKKNSKIYANSHNDYLLYLVHYGAVGCLLFILIFWSIFREAWLLAKTNSDMKIKQILFSYIAGLSGYCMAMGFVNIIQPRYLFWSYTAIILKYGVVDLGKNNESS